MTAGARIVIVLLIVSLLAGIISGVQLYFRLTYIWALLLIVSWVWSWHILRGVKMIRKARTTRAQVGQILEERIEVENPGRLPRLWLTVSDSSTVPGSQASRIGLGDWPDRFGKVDDLGRYDRLHQRK